MACGGNPGPFPAAAGRFVIETIVATGAAQPVVHVHEDRAPGDRWTENMRSRSRSAGSANGMLYELVDLAAQRDAVEHKWENRKDYPDMSDLPASVGMLFQPFEHMVTSSAEGPRPRLRGPEARDRRTSDVSRRDRARCQRRISADQRMRVVPGARQTPRHERGCRTEHDELRR